MKKEELEKVTQQEIIEYLVAKQFILLRVNNIVSRRGQRFIRSVIRCGNGESKGVSDLIGCTKYGQFFAIEVKRKGEFATPEQIDFLESVRTKGGIAILAYELSQVVACMESLVDSGHHVVPKSNSDFQKPTSRTSKKR